MRPRCCPPEADRPDGSNAPEAYQPAIFGRKKRERRASVPPRSPIGAATSPSRYRSPGRDAGLILPVGRSMDGRWGRGYSENRERGGVKAAVGDVAMVRAIGRRPRQGSWVSSLDTDCDPA